MRQLDYARKNTPIVRPFGALPFAGGLPPPPPSLKLTTPAPVFDKLAISHPDPSASVLASRSAEHLGDQSCISSSTDGRKDDIESTEGGPWGTIAGDSLKRSTSGENNNATISATVVAGVTRSEMSPSSESAAWGLLDVALRALAVVSSKGVEVVRQAREGQVGFIHL